LGSPPPPPPDDDADVLGRADYDMAPPGRARGDGGKVPAEFEELVKPHVASFDYFLGEGLQALVQSVKPVMVGPLSPPITFETLLKP
jgi:hypothetical protein